MVKNNLSDMAKGLVKKEEIPKNIIKIMEVLEKERRIFITGKAGSGKSTIISKIVKHYEHTWVMATTGIASINVSGETYHSALCIDIIPDLETLKRSDAKNRFSDRFRAMQTTLLKTETIIIDEISMADREAMRMILYRIKEYPKIKLLIVGDFMQLQPVQGRPLYISKIFTEKFGVLKLRKNWRQIEDESFMTMLDEIRNSEVSNKTKYDLLELEDNIIEGAVKLRSRNNQVDEINEEELDGCEGELKISSRVITYKHPKVDKYALDGILHNVREPEMFKYKQGARVMVTKNIKTKGLYNGDLATILRDSPNGIELMLDRGSKIVWINKHEYEHEILLSGKKVSAVKYKAFPLMLAWAITIHKSQGLTLDKIDIDCAGIFAQSQFYVAISRARTMKGVQLHNTGTLEFRRNRKLLPKYYVK